MAKISIIPWIVKKLKRCIGIVEDTDTASQAIASNKYVIWKGDVCKSTSAISEGDTLSSSNLSPVTGGVGNDLSQDIAKFQTVPINATTNASGSFSTNIDYGSYILLGASFNTDLNVTGYAMYNSKIWILTDKQSATVTGTALFYKYN